MDNKKKPTALELFKAQVDPASVSDAMVPIAFQTEDSQDEHALKRAQLRALEALQRKQ